MSYESLYNPYSSCLLHETYNDSFSVQSNKFSKGTITNNIKFSNGILKFDGISGKITRKFRSNNIKTIILNIKPISLSKDLLKLSSSVNIKLINGVVTLAGISGGIITIDGIVTSKIGLNKFQKIVINTPNNIIVNDLQEGIVTSNYFDGYIDLFELYNVQYFGQ